LATHGSAYIAHAQAAGKGQRGKQWWSVSGQNIALSVVLDTAKLSTSEGFRLSAMVAVAVLDWLQQIAPGPWQTKWPNDIYHNDRKAGGILIENVMKGGAWNRSVVGIGINMNQHSFPGHLPNPVSLRMITRKIYACAESARDLCGFLEQRWQQLIGGGWLTILEDYNMSLYGKGKICRIKKESAVIPCLIKAVNSQGQLIAGENNEYVFDFGEVSWVPNPQPSEGGHGLHLT
jgi:BirA family biotin operon repressor/biotin-[acetyl-CoA-carboxylase] ligase